MLSGFCLELARSFYMRNKSEMNIKNIFSADIKSELSYRLKERKTFDVSDRSSDLDKNYIVFPKYVNLLFISLVICGMT